MRASEARFVILMVWQNIVFVSLSYRSGVRQSLRVGEAQHYNNWHLA
jgi:hypothetical protein